MNPHLDDLAIGASHAASLRERLVGAGEKVEDADGLYEPLQAAQRRFLDTVWPRHRRRIGAANRWLERRFLIREGMAIDDLTTALDLVDSGLRIPSYLVSELPGKAIGLGSRSGDPRFAAFVASVAGDDRLQVAHSLLSSSAMLLRLTSAGGSGSLEETARNSRVYRRLLEELGRRERAGAGHQVGAQHDLEMGQAAATLHRVFGWQIDRDERQNAIQEALRRGDLDEAIRRIASL